MEDYDKDYHEIAGKYELIDLEVSPDQLLLDPNNLRFILSEDEIKDYTASDIADEKRQEKIYRRLIESSSFDVHGVVTRIKQNGWISEGGFYVKKVKGEKEDYCILKSS